jgi:hypothetical protein
VLHAAAVGGGTSHHSFPGAERAKEELNQVLQQIAGGSVSRTLPVFGAVSTSFSQQTSSNAPATGYELRSSMDVSGDGSLWRGHLERVRYTCDANSSEPVAKVVDDQKGDRFELDRTHRRQPGGASYGCPEERRGCEWHAAAEPERPERLRRLAAQWSRSIRSAERQ